MTQIRALERHETPEVARLYADFVGWRSPDRSAFDRFYEEVLFDNPFADPEIPPLVYEDPDLGIVGFVGSNPRPFTFEGRRIRVACSGPIVVAPSHHRQGLATQLKRSYGEGPQDMTVNDRVVDRVHPKWVSLGSTTDAVGSIGWVRVLAPATAAADRLSQRLVRRRPPGRRLLRRAEGRLGRRRPAPGAGVSEPLEPEAMIDLFSRLQEEFPLQPAYDVASLSWVLGRMAVIDQHLGHLVARAVRDPDGRIVAAFVMYVQPAAQAHVVQLVCGSADAGLVLDHLFEDAAAEGAVELRGRLQRHLLAPLWDRDARLVKDYWSIVQADDPGLAEAVLSGRSLMSRMEGEWWMRPSGELNRAAAPASTA